MATAMYLEHYLDSLESLPGELQRNFSLMKDLDQKAQELMNEIDDKAEGYLSSVRTMSPEKRTDLLTALQKLFSKSREFGDDKVQLAMQTYEMVDKHIRKLDADLARFEADLRDKSQSKPNDDDKADTGKKSNLKEKDKKKRKSMKEEFDDEIPKKKKKKGQGASNEQTPPPMISPLLSLTMNNPSDVLDMPVDPNEPTYCLCHQVSYGEMIGCDNLDCPIEWFHLSIHLYECDLCVTWGHLSIHLYECDLCVTWGLLSIHLYECDLCMTWGHISTHFYECDMGSHIHTFM
ncbi:inhibitor of growth protein 4-like isoform X3 [Mya arenaria]|uniref:inhibitor of growth protein 4-like isoform X3 n=1 Tax=Mya arenaria TaxID=6604 RepID=UPI0022E033DA|nr:inhibitor of growth protein 4-like isoform X3 [Mya arenaria]